MKKLLTAFVGLLMMFALASCGGNNVATVNGEDVYKRKGYDETAFYKDEWSW